MIIDKRITFSYPLRQATSITEVYLFIQRQLAFAAAFNTMGVLGCKFSVHIPFSSVLKFFVPCRETVAWLSNTINRLAAS